MKKQQIYVSTEVKFHLKYLQSIEIVLFEEKRTFSDLILSMIDTFYSDHNIEKPELKGNVEKTKK